MGGAAMSPPRKPPRRSALAWARAELFASPVDAAFTVLGSLLVAWLAWRALQWAVLDAVWTGESRVACRAGGACWAMVTARWRQVLTGFYPEGHEWRLAVASACLVAALLPFAVRRLPAWSWILSPLGVLAAFAVAGGAHVLPRVPTDYWGGVFLNVLIGVTGAVFALPIGILLALGRRSRLPVVKAVSVGFIELVRGAPLITLLFMASVVLPLFLPQGVSLSRLLRAMVVITLFESAYMAEVVRGGLQAVPDGQREAARALGLGPVRTTALVVLPQALRISIPAMVNTFIGLFKDTTLVFVIALLEVTGVMRNALGDYAWQGLDTEGYAFVAFVFWIACFTMSRWAASLERPAGPPSLQEPA
jgi:general L-amino acid transport system permease protein